MDKKNIILGVAFFAAGLLTLFWQSARMAEYEREQADEKQRAAEASPDSEESGDASPRDGEGRPSALADQGRADAPEDPEAADDAKAMQDMLAKPAAEAAEAEGGATGVQDAPPERDAAEETVVLENAHLRVEFTTYGGAIRTVSFKQTKRGGPDDYVFNKNGALPALSLSLAGKEGGLREFAPVHSIASRSKRAVTFRLDMGNGIRLARTYRLNGPDSEGDPYVIAHATRFENVSDAAKALSTIYLNLGTAIPSDLNDEARYLNAGYYDGEGTEFVNIWKAPFLWMDGELKVPEDGETLSGDIQWASVKNQFFASVLTAGEPGRELHVEPVDVAAAEGSAGAPNYGVTASVGYDLGTLPAGGEKRLESDYYVGPKEFLRLQRLGDDQDEVMQFGFFGFFSKLLLSFMHAIHAVVPSWGWSIVIMTVIIKLLFWPLTAKATKSQKRMQKIQQPMQELREQYKDNPQKMQQETMKLFKEHRVNPAAGCLPILIQMPIFIGLFYMLRTASELRFAPFLWINDLSQPDTVAEIAGFPINILPLIMGATMFFQMRMTPTSPTADPTQQKIMRMLPMVFLVFLYNFSSGLVLYWTVQNLLTIVQTKITHSRADDEESAASDAGSEQAAKKAKPAKKAKKAKPASPAPGAEPKLERGSPSTKPRKKRR